MARSNVPYLFYLRFFYTDCKDLSFKLPNFVEQLLKQTIP